MGRTIKNSNRIAFLRVAISYSPFLSMYSLFLYFIFTLYSWALFSFDDIEGSCVIQPTITYIFLRMIFVLLSLFLHPLSDANASKFFSLFVSTCDTKVKENISKSLYCYFVTLIIDACDGCALHSAGELIWLKFPCVRSYSTNTLNKRT